MDALEAISSPQPEIAENEVSRVLRAEFGVTGTLEPLLSERDQNFSVKCADGRRFVFKIANSTESKLATDFQIKALLHVELQQRAVATPIIHRTLSGNDSALIYDEDVAHVCRLVSYLSGVPLSKIEVTPQLAADLGSNAAELDLALSNFEHPCDNQVLLWDLQRAGSLRELLDYVEDAELHAAVATCLDDFDDLIEPVLDSLRRQVIHGDLNSDNLLADVGDSELLAGVIDFGDMVRAPLIMEVAIAASYLRVDGGDALSLIAPFVAAYNRVRPLQQDELVLLFDLIRARLAATISILRWRIATRGAGDDYSRVYFEGERSAEKFLFRLDSMGRASFTASILGGCHR